MGNDQRDQKQASPSKVQRSSLWRLQPSAQLYLLHAALLTFGLAIQSLFFNLAIEAFGYEITFLGLLNTVAVLVGGLAALPLWWLVTRYIGVYQALLLSALLNAAAIMTVALWPTALPLLLGVTLTGPAAVMFQISAAPFMMNHSSAAERDFLFSLNAGINIGVAGIGSLVGGFLPGLAVNLFGVLPQSGVAYRITFAVAGLCVFGAALALLFIKAPRDQQSGPSQRSENTATAPQQNPSITSRAALRHIFAALKATRRDWAEWERRPQGELQSSWPGLRLWSAFSAHWSRFIERGSFIPEPWRSMLQNPWPALRFALPPLVISFGAALLIPYLNLYFRQRYAVSDEALGAIFAAIGISTGVATLAAPWFSRRFGKMGSVVLTQGLAVPCLLALGFAPFLGVAIGVAITRGALMNMASPLYDAYAMEHSAEELRPAVIGLINGAFGIGYLFAPRISTHIQATYGFMPLFLATAACYTLAAILTYLLFIYGGQRMPVHSDEREAVST
jgi:MFS family permease